MSSIGHVMGTLVAFWPILANFGWFWLILDDFWTIFGRFLCISWVPYVRAYQNCKKVGDMSSIGQVMGTLVGFWPILVVLVSFSQFWLNFAQFLSDFFAFPGCSMWECSKPVKKLAPCLQLAQLFAYPTVVQMRGKSPKIKMPFLGEKTGFWEFPRNNIPEIL